MLPSSARPQPTIRRIGYLHPSDPTDVAWPSFMRGLKEHGYAVGKDVIVEARFAGGHVERLPALAGQLVDAHVEVLIAVSPAAIRAARAATRTVPIVMAFSGDDPVRAGFAETLAHPGGNTTGLTAMSLDIVPKKLELLHELLPDLKVVGVLRSPQGVDHAAQVMALQAPAQRLGLRLEVVEVQGDDYPPAFARFASAGSQALIVLSGPEFTRNRQLLVSLAARYRLPTVYTFADFVEIGGLASYGPDIADLSMRAAAYVEKILNGANPGDLPIEQPRRLYLALNRSVARQLGLEIPTALLVQADRLIQ